MQIRFIRKMSGTGIRLSLFIPGQKFPDIIHGISSVRADSQFGAEQIPPYAKRKRSNRNFSRQEFPGFEQGSGTCAGRCLSAEQLQNPVHKLRISFRRHASVIR
ncbi:hypothetical protein D3C71_1522860 [compost metagenome]